MSFILDALRKSEHERERRSVPGLVGVQRAQAPRSRLPWALAAVALLLAVNVAVLLYVIRPPAAVPAATIATAPARASSEATVAALAAVPRPAPSPPPLVRPLASEVASADPASDVPEPALAGAAPALPAPRPPAPLPADADAGLQTVRELPTAVAAALPALHLDLHVWSSDRAQRFVIVNGERLREGAQVQEGLSLVAITPRGAVLDFRGRRFLLTRE